MAADGLEAQARGPGENRPSHAGKNWSRWYTAPLLWGLFAFVLILAAALLWYPPLWQPSYSVANSAPFAAVQGEDKLNVNTATREELMLLPGVGEQKARAIIEYREQNGPFGSLEELGEVKGIGPGILSQIQNRIVF